jgi:amino-acid N-acetyltransferase
VIGCAAVRKNGDVGYLYGLAVDKAWRRRGIGHALTEERLDWLRNEAASTAYVLAMFWNVRFFRKHGFELADRSLARELEHLHGDFSQSWSARSALLKLKFQ